MDQKLKKGLVLRDGSTILDVRPEQIIIMSPDQGPLTIRNTAYHRIRHLENVDRRISYRFNSRNHLLETYNKGVFNCVYNGRLFQTRAGFADMICEQIEAHMSGDKKALSRYARIVGEAARETPMYDLLDLYLGRMPGVKKTKKGYWLHDGAFLVTLSTTTYIYRDGKRVKPLSLVHDGIGTNPSLPGPDGRIIRANHLTLSLISRVCFLLRPDMEDRRFLNQLPIDVRRRLADRLEAQRTAEARLLGEDPGARAAK